MIEKQDLVTTRDYTLNDRNFILATFLRGLYYGESWFSKIPKDIFMKNYHNYIERLLESPTVKVRVACLKDDMDIILAYAILSTDDTILHWVFAKKAWRSIGLAKSLVPPTVNAVTHLTNVGESLLKKRQGIDFNPFAI